MYRRWSGNPEEEMISKTTLKRRGWTDSLINRFYPVPDKIMPNPLCRSGGNMTLYYKDKVLDIEISREFRMAEQERKAKKEAAKKAAETKRQKTRDYANAINFENIPILDKHNLIRKACDHYNNLWFTRGRYDKFADKKSADQEFIKRICINYLRHCATNYDYELVGLYKKTGRSEAYEIIRANVDETIKETYPWLFEADKQNKAS